MEQKFWKPNSKDSAGVKLPVDKKAKKGAKALGVTGGILLVVLAVFGLLTYKFVIDPALALKSRVDQLKEDGQLANKAFWTRTW